MALRDILQRRAISVANGAQRKLTVSRLLQRTTLVTQSGHEIAAGRTRRIALAMVKSGKCHACRGTE